MLWLLTRLRLVRLLNIAGTQLQFSVFRKKKGRQGTATKSKAGPIVGLMVFVAMLFSFASMAHQGIQNLHRDLDFSSAHQASVASKTPETGVRGGTSELTSGPFSEAMTAGLTMMLTLLLCTGIFSDIGSRELAKPDWDLEWLITLPIGITSLIWGRILGRAATSAFGLFAFWPLCAMIAWYSGSGWWAIGVGAVAMIPLLVLSALGQTLVEVGLRLSLSPPKLRNLQAVMSVLGLLGLFLVMSITSSTGGLGLQLAQHTPTWTTWLPPGLVVRAINAQGVDASAGFTLLLVTQMVAVMWLGVWWLRYQLRQGLVSSGGRESSRNTPVLNDSTSNRFTYVLKSAVQRRELTLLLRDRNFMVQTLLLPVVIVGGQFAMNGGVESLVGIWSSTQTMASVAFGVAAYMLMLSAFQNLNTEGAALWMLFTFPCSILSVLKEKASLWAVLGLAYPSLILSVGVVITTDSFWNYLGYSALVVIGVAIYSAIAVALGVFASNPLAQENGARVRPSYLYLFTLLSAMYVYAIAAAVWWQSLVFVVLSCLLALAMWQKAADQLPFLLDPTEAPPARVSTSDGIIAAMMFFVFQIIISAVLVAADRPLDGTLTLVSFSGSGALTYVLVRLVYWRSKTASVPRVLSGFQWSTLMMGGIGGAVAAVIGLAYVWMARQIGAMDSSTGLSGEWSTAWWLLALSVIAAPMFEEFIFRGLIFGGLRRTMGLLPAVVASAAIFAVVHPPMSILPVFALGVCAAITYERTKVLLAPMVVHAIYNLCVLGYQIGGVARH
jgi:membrane protease YdiL (CAAX protease family)